MIPKKLLIVLVGTSLILCSCHNNPMNAEPEPGKRNYVWELDTLNMPMNYISSVWGAAPDNVWAIGHGGTQDDRLLHYDGAQWSTYTKETIWCSGLILYGFSEYDVWMGGGAGWLASGAGIWHYDGVEWKQNYVYSIDEDYWDITVEDIWGTSPNDIYACGIIVFDDGKNGIFRGFALHYDGKNWREIARADFNSQFLTIRKEDDNVYVFSYGINYETGDGDLEFHQVKGNELRQIFSKKESEINWAGLSSINSKVNFIIENDVFQYKNKKFTKFISIDSEKFYWNICGRHEYDIFIAMSDGIAHYNGTDIEYIYRFPSERMSIIGQPLILEKDIFYGIWCTDTQFYNIVLHGTLNE